MYILIGMGIIATTIVVLVYLSYHFSCKHKYSIEKERYSVTRTNTVYIKECEHCHSLIKYEF